jgi:anti-sigma factor RsiW
MLTMTDDLACRDLVELVTEYLEGGLDSSMRDRFARHLAECPYCQIFVEQMRATIELARRVEVDQIDPDVRQRLLDAFSGWHNREA